MAANGEISRKLTPKQQRLIEEYLIDLNATQAAIRAGYSAKTAQQAGSENLSKPVIRDAIEQAMAERSKQTDVDAEYVIERLKTEAELTGNGSSHSARVAALAHLGKHLGMFIEKHNVNHSLTTKIIELPPAGQEDMHRVKQD